MPAKILDLFESSWDVYSTFLTDYEEHKKLLDEIKYELADH